MRRVLTWIVGSVLWLSCGCAVAQERPQTVSAYFGGSGLVPFSDLSQRADIGFGGSGVLAVRPAPESSPELALELHLAYDVFGSARDEEGDVSFLLTGVGLRLDHMSAGRPGLFITIRGGLASVSVGEDTGAGRPELTESDPYAAVGVGFESRRFFVQAQVVNVFGTFIKNYTWLPVTAGVRF